MHPILAGRANIRIRLVIDRHKIKVLHKKIWKRMQGPSRKDLGRSYVVQSRDDNYKEVRAGKAATANIEILDTKRRQEPNK